MYQENNYEEIFEDTLTEEFRQNHIGGSDIGIILGFSPFKSPYVLWLEKLGYIEPPETNEAMKRGKELEMTARDEYIKKTKNSVDPKNFVYKPYPVLSCSLDGISKDRKLVYEAKCPTSDKLFTNAVTYNSIPQYYVAQVQQYMFIMNADVCDFHIYMNEQQSVIINVYPDRDMHKLILNKAKEFWHMIETKTPPPRRDGDPFLEEDKDLEQIANEWKDLKLKMKEIESSYKEKEKILKENINDEKKVIFGKSRVTATFYEGREITDWDRVKEDYHLTEEILNNYSKKTASYITLKM